MFWKHSPRVTQVIVSYRTAFTLFESNRNLIKEADKQDKSPLQLACQHGHYKVIKAFEAQLQEDILDRCDKKGNSLMHFACMRVVVIEVNDLDQTCVEKFKEELEKMDGVHKIELRNKKARVGYDLATSPTKLCDALNKYEAKVQELCFNQHESEEKVEILKLLIEKGAKTEAANHDRKTPLHISSEYGFKGIVEFLVRQGVPIKGGVDHNCSPLHLAAKHNQMEVIEFLHQW